MAKSFWAQIQLDEALIESLTEADVKQVCEEIESHVSGVWKVVPADPETYVGE